jgi:[glutamine synthetase] adenylyltransferase / [glutamine synthetase]-adenylyl-L-tyrosine phosphorylase
MITPEVLGRTLAEAPDPELARVALSRVGEDASAREALSAPEVLPVAVRLLGFSRAAADFLVSHPREAGALADVRPRSRAELDDELAADVEGHGVEAGLRIFRRRAMLRIAARDLAGAPLEEIVAEISDVAGACLDAAVRATGGDGLAVIGLGKLGGAELNYSSDVDLLFVHAADSDGGEARAAEVVRLLSETTEEGVALRVDTDLRPGGRGGAMSRTLAATLRHYEAAAATWERQALIKARAVGGDEELGRRFVESVAEFVYPEELPPDAIDEVRRVKVRLEEYVRARGKADVEVKRGRGGIRDVEFAVQLLQIVHGRRDLSLREPNTLRALAALAEGGYAAETDAAALADAYRFLRRLEHRLQMVRDLQTHELPADAASLRVLARAMGLSSADGLREAYRERTELVRDLHERLFYRPLLHAFADAGTPQPGVDRAATEELLRGLGFSDASSAYEVLERLVDPAARVGRVIAHVFPMMLRPLAYASDPDAALVRLERVAAAVGEEGASTDELARSPELASRLAHVVAASSFATGILVARPELLPSIGAREHPDPDGDPQDGLLHVVAGYADRSLASRDVGTALAEVAGSVVRRAVADAAPAVPFAAIALGKLGARELNFASDLDLVFVYEGEGSHAFAAASRAAEEVLRRVRDSGWEPDADLRPEGRSGPLARSIAGFLEYWERWAEPWEFQSLLRARAVGGDEGLGRRFLSLAADFAYPERLTVDREAEVLRMRGRIERERVKPPEAARFHFKLGYGSLADVQFAVEVLLMRHGHEHPEIRTPRTLDAITALTSARLLEDSVGRALGEAFLFLSGVKNALEVDRRIHAEALPGSPVEQQALARRLGYEEYPRQSFLADYRRVTRRARRAMERVFTASEE